MPFPDGGSTGPELRGRLPPLLALARRQRGVPPRQRVELLKRRPGDTQRLYTGDTRQSTLLPFDGNPSEWVFRQSLLIDGWPHFQ